MNDWNDLETQLRSWTPRRPSKGLESRIFAAAAASAPAAAAAPLRLHWLAPAMAGLLMMGVLFNQHYGGSALSGSGTGPVVAMILSNQSAPAYLPGSFQGDRNTIPADAFEFTNAHVNASGIVAPSRSRVNN
jgi:hypothetical protein